MILAFVSNISARLLDEGTGPLRNNSLHPCNLQVSQTKGLINREIALVHVLSLRVPQREREPRIELSGGRRKAFYDRTSCERCRN